MKSLLDVEDFGAIDAESDALLGRCFEDHPTYHEVQSGRRFLVLGRKGSGKTAIYKKILTLDDPSVFTIGYSFIDYPWHYHDAQVIPTAAEQERYLHSWRYLILLTLSKILLNKDHSQPWSEDALEALRKLEAFVIDTYGSRDPDVTEIFHPGRKLRRLKDLQIDLKFLKIFHESDELAITSLPKVFQDVNRSLQKLVLCTLNPNNRYYVCFDQLDIGFQPDLDEYKQRLIGLILAARDFANLARESGRSLKVLVFLRSDIYYNSLLFEDKNKITDTYGIEIEWESQAKSPRLKSLMEKRITEVLSDPNASWETVFDETQEMRGRQSKYQHIIDRTFCRPRDIIKFCNSVLKVYKDRRRKGEDDNAKIVNEDMNLARPEYSKYLRDEIIDEIYRYYSDYRFYFEILRQIGYQQFSLMEFEDAFALWQDRLNSLCQPIDVLERLYGFSVIGFYRAGGSGYGGSEYVYKYLDERAEFNRSAERFRVHWGLVEALGLKQYSRS